MFYIKFIILIIGIISVFNGCSKEIYVSERFPSTGMVKSLSSSSMYLVNRPYSRYLKGDDLTRNSLQRAISKSMIYLERIPPDRPFRYGNMIYTAEEVKASFLLFLSVIRSETKYSDFIRTLEENFHLFQSSANLEERVLFTGYYEPIFKGSLVRTEEYNVPVYAVPDDLLVLELGRFRDSLNNRTIVYKLKEGNVEPYYTREDIMEKRVLDGQKKEIAWMKDPIDLFFMQIQGSGMLELPNGEKLRLSYNGSNGHEYSSIGRLLIEEGTMELEEVSMDSIREYLNSHPESRDRILYHNKSYVFFTIDEDEEGPKGNIDVPLTPHRSIATDSTIFPKGALAYISADMPVFRKNWRVPEQETFARFAIIQDTGGAIKGPGRVDLFWGNGKLAEKSAGNMRSFGMLYVLIAKKEALAAFIGDQL